jgi:pimeloyl-ACP methyl ester carboxylesterase
MERRRETVSAPDGRKLEVEVAGPDDGEVIVFHTGTPSVGSIFEPMLEAGAERGLRHVSYARPGYAGSDRHPGRSHADCVADVEAILDHLGVDRFYVTGHSGGGPHSLACAALLPDRVRSAATTASVAPFDAEGLDWLAGMGQENLDEFAAQQAGDAELQRFLEKWAGVMRSVTPDQVIDALGDLLPDADREVLTGALAEFSAASMRAAVSSGIWGWFDDDVSVLADWGFDLGTIEVPVAIWQGEEDRMVPFAHGQWLAEHVSGAKAHLLPGEGHISLEVGSYGDVLDQLIASAAA